MAATDAMTNLAPIALWRPPGELRRKLIELRVDMLDRMQRRGTVEPAHLPVIAGINAALDAFDSMPVSTTSAARAVVSDDGSTIRLTLYGKAGAVAAVELDPVSALGLVGTLIEAALPRLSSRIG